jgi:hypothetical protein
MGDLLLPALFFDNVCDSYEARVGRGLFVELERR